MIYKNHQFDLGEIDHREKLRDLYKYGYGPKELFNILNDAGVFRVIRPEELDARNRAILKAEEIGLLDENVIRDTIETYLNDPHVLEREMQNIRKDKEKADPSYFDGSDNI